MPAALLLSLYLALVSFRNELFYLQGLLGDDKALAGAIWRILYGYQEADAEKLELFVHYIRTCINIILSIS